MTYIAVVNHSTRVPAHELDLMVRAVAHQLRNDVSPVWGLKPVNVIRHDAKDTTIPVGAYVIGIYDDADQANALGYHTENAGYIYGKVFAAPVLDNGGTLIEGALSVSAVLSHEVLETYVDPRAQLWAASENGYQYAYEICDAVENSAYDVTVSGTKVGVSNFVLPGWFDNEERGEKLDFLGHLTQPFQIERGGYVVLMREGNMSQKFGDEFLDWKKPGKVHELSRYARRHR